MVRETRDSLSDRPWDLVCVGTGISALTYGALRLREAPGQRMLFLEQHNVPGGYSSEFVRPKQGARFDCSLHKLTGMGETGNLRQLFRELDLESRVELVFSPAWFQVAGGVELMLDQVSSRMRDALCEAFPDEAAAIDAFLYEVEVHGRNSYMQFEVMLGRFEPDFKALRVAHRTLKTITVLDALRARFKDPRLIEILSLPAIYIGAFPEQCAYLYYLHVVYASLYERSAYMRGGSQQLSRLLVSQIESMGGEVRFRTDVEQVLIDPDSGLATGVKTDRGEVRADRVMINASPRYALETLLLPLDALAPHRARAAEQVTANATTTLYLVLDCPPESVGLDHAETMVLADDPLAALEARRQARARPTEAALCERAYWGASSFEVTNYHALDPSGGAVVIVNALDDIRHWPARKTPEYRQKKRRVAEQLLARLDQVRPGLRGHVRYSEVSSPRTYERYTRNSAGSGYGNLVLPEATPNLINHNFPVRNLSFLSAWISGSGYEATMGYARMLVRSAPPARLARTGTDRSF